METRSRFSRIVPYSNQRRVCDRAPDSSRTSGHVRFVPNSEIAVQTMIKMIELIWIRAYRSRVSAVRLDLCRGARARLVNRLTAQVDGGCCVGARCVETSSLNRGRA